MKKWNDRLLSLLNRDHLPQFLQANAPNGRMVEVGTYYGEFAEHILKGWPGGSLYCVDPWEDQGDMDYRDGCANGGRAGGRNPMEPIFVKACGRLNGYGTRCTIHRCYSDEGVKRFQEESLDCVYIDGNHAFGNAICDLRDWSKKVKHGGLIGIHDCYIREDAVQRCGVADAVWFFSHEIEQRPFITNCTSAWWIKE